MPTEYRQIVLSASELEDAVRFYRRAKPDLLPPGDLVAVRVQPDEASPATVVTIKNSYDPRGSDVVVHLKPQDIAELLIRFCMVSKVPVPRAGTKSFRYVSGQLALIVKFAH